MKTLLELKKQIIEICSHSNEGHIPSAFSILDIIWVLYNRVLKVDPGNVRDLERDFFILSKGHGSLGLYSVLAAKGFINSEDFQSFGKYNSLLGGHPDLNKVPGVEASTGSLGHGLPFAVGLAYSHNILRRSSRVFALIGDGEANEGTIWESALIASQHKLHSLNVIVDFNHSTDRAIQLGSLAQKFDSFGFEVLSIQGHDHAAIFDACSAVTQKPKAIIAETIKGYGCKSLENNPAWHHKSPSSVEALQLIGELGL